MNLNKSCIYSILPISIDTLTKLCYYQSENYYYLSNYNNKGDNL